VRRAGFTLVLAAVASTAAAPGAAGELPYFLADRGTGIPTSMFGTYVDEGSLLVYPFFEYYYDNDTEYSPSELGYGADIDYRGRTRASEWLLFLGYGFTDWLALELEAAYITQSLERADDDTSGMPDRIEESGLGDVEGQFRLRLMRETGNRPELFGLFEFVFPIQSDGDVLIGTADWEFKLGAGVTRGFRWGTVTVRAAVEYSAEEDKAELGEYAVEYLKRLSPHWRVYLGVEGSQDEVEGIADAQWHISDRVFVRLDSAFGLTSKATDWAPEVGVLFTL
jgi:hypothetical protein